MVKPFLKLFSNNLVLKESSSETLMMEVQRGSKEAFEVLYDRHKTQIYSYIDNMVRSKAWAQELTQDSFMRAFEKKALYREQYTFTSWLYSIARNLTLDELKRKDASRFQVTLKDVDGGEITVENLESTDDGPFEEVFVKLQREQVQTAIGQLKDEYQDVINMRIFSEMSYDEIANELGIKVSSVKTHLNRAKKELVAILKEGKNEK
jgi:RNA polymerase sigma-70 factor (ECF subfamily)